MTKSTTTEATPTKATAKPPILPHADWCKGERVETTDYPDRGITTTHCVDCGAHQARDRKGATLATPAVTGGLVAQGRGDWDVTMEKAPGSRDMTAPWPAHADTTEGV